MRSAAVSAAGMPSARLAHRWVRHELAWGWFFVAAGVLGFGCATPPRSTPVPRQLPPEPVADSTVVWREAPGPDSAWRPHLLSRCRGDDQAPPAVETSLALSYELFRNQSGSDAIMELELCLRRYPRDGLLLLTLGQLYLMAGQGEPWLLPREGPAADVGSWQRNRERLLARAQQLLTDALTVRTDDGAPYFLLADAHRAAGDSVSAEQALAQGLDKCSRQRSLEIMRRHQKLGAHPVRLLHNEPPEYPADLVSAGVEGEVVLDLLVSPAGSVVQVVPLSSPEPRLTAAASAALRRAVFQPARQGKYPIWAWIRIPTFFSLAD